MIDEICINKRPPPIASRQNALCFVFLTLIYNFIGGLLGALFNHINVKLTMFRKK